MCRTMPLCNDYLKSKGLPSLRGLWLVFKYEDQAQLWPGRPDLTSRSVSIVLAGN